MPAADGSLLLSAANGEIYGPTIVLEKQYGNLGYWSSTDDRAVWTVEAARPGRYAVWLDWACHRRCGWQNVPVASRPQSDDGSRWTSTGNWDTYRQAKVGEIVLAGGRQR